MATDHDNLRSPWPVTSHIRPQHNVGFWEMGLQSSAFANEQNFPEALLCSSEFM